MKKILIVIGIGVLVALCAGCTDNLENNNGSSTVHISNNTTDNPEPSVLNNTTESQVIINPELGTFEHDFNFVITKTKYIDPETKLSNGNFYVIFDCEMNNTGNETYNCSLNHFQMEWNDIIYPPSPATFSQNINHPGKMSSDDLLVQPGEVLNFQIVYEIDGSQMFPEGTNSVLMSYYDDVPEYTYPQRIVRK